MSLAQQARDACPASGLAAKSYYAGYAVGYNGDRVMFPKGTPQNESHWPNGRTKRVTYVYADGSKLLVTCRENSGQSDAKVVKANHFR